MTHTPLARRPDPQGVNARTFTRFMLVTLLFVAPLLAIAYPFVVVTVALAATGIVAGLGLLHLHRRRRLGRTRTVCLPGASVCVEV